ncbi:aminotransferase class V-fold PLP-dependent enzyme [Rhodobacteraceae bacterium CCMM004]|nr:aminotransferase class V-fold PLP-dependent enzyme [Rhodobacteraceae bacterium CCMM004]
MEDLRSFARRMSALPLDALRSGLIGNGAVFDGPFGPRRLLYADWIASGRALTQVEDFVRESVLPFYANSHSEASHCGRASTRLREAARAEIGRITGCGGDTHVIFAGSGATAGINRVVGLLDIAGRTAAGQRTTVLIGPYEHHSNILPWRESGAEVVELPELPGGGVDLAALDAALDAADADLVVGAFSACSNVTGILTDVDAVTRRLKAHGALAVWDYAGGGAYLPIEMGPPGPAAKDAVVLSPHKFPGGPGASGVLLARDTVVRRRTPTAPGGGTVTFVSPWDHDYADDVARREEGGTPNVIGDIRAALAFLVKEAVGVETIHARDAALRARAVAVLTGHPRVELFGADATAPALPFLSFRIGDGQGGHIHHQLVTRLLSDRWGIQARGGCACAGPYGHRLLGIDSAGSGALRERIAAGDELAKPGWVRLSLNYLHDDDEAERILTAICSLADRGTELARPYTADPATARFSADPVCARGDGDTVAARGLPVEPPRGQGLTTTNGESGRA